MKYPGAADLMSKLRQLSEEEQQVLTVPFNMWLECHNEVLDWRLAAAQCSVLAQATKADKPVQWRHAQADAILRIHFELSALRRELDAERKKSWWKKLLEVITPRV